jgi:hypothetical protein
MPSDREPRWSGIAASYAVLLAVLGAAASLAYDVAAPAYRPPVIRFAVVLAMGVALFHILSRWRRSVQGEPQSRFEAALTRQSIPLKIEAAFLKSRDAVARSVTSQSSFEHLASARLSVLWEAGSGPAGIPMPVYRRWLGLGPSRQAVAALVAQIEEARADRR